MKKEKHYILDIPVKGKLNIGVYSTSDDRKDIIEKALKVVKDHLEWCLGLGHGFPVEISSSLADIVWTC